MTWANDVYKPPACIFRIDWVLALQSWDLRENRWVIFDYQTLKAFFTVKELK